MTLRQLSRLAFERLDNVFDSAFGPAWNPFYQLGALGWFFYWIVAVTGIYLFIFFDTGVVKAYESVEAITHAQWYAGGVMRSLHRYASDALVVVMLIHLVREFVYDRFRGPRWLAWVTGVPVLWFVFASGVSGYWLVWDRLAQYIAIATTEWLDTLPIFVQPIARNFLHPDNLSDRFFTLMVFVHIVVPLFLLLVMWIHIQRATKPVINPPRGLAAGTLAMLLLLSFVFPALSQGPADLNAVPAVVNLDWFYLAIYPLLDFMDGLWLWAALGLLTLMVLWLPWLPAKKPGPAAVVDLDHCNGCGRCVADCPFVAVMLGPRSDGLPFAQEAVVDPALCVACGICAGACPTATPFRRRTELIPGIDLPALPVRVLREQTLVATAALTGDARVLVYGCRYGAPLEALRGEGVAAIALPCVAALPPSFLDFILSGGHADGVLLTGCRAGDCHYRLGASWTEARLAGTRDPMLRARVPRDRLRAVWPGLARTAELERALADFRAKLRALGPYASPAREPNSVSSQEAARRA